jgi:hypothetical protein
MQQNRVFFDAKTITPSDTASITPTSGIMVTAAGNIVVNTLNGTTITLAVTVGTIYPVCVTQVKATGTTATGIVGLY